MASKTKQEVYTIHPDRVFSWCWVNEARHKQCPAQIIHWKAEGNTTPTNCLCECHVKKKATTK